jgi:hypothetical protein
MTGRRLLQDDSEHISTNDVRAGSTPHIVRYVLGISLVLAILGMAIVLAL